MDARRYPALPGLLSSARLAPYVAGSAGDQDSAIQLYTWNLALSGTLWGPLGMAEVVTRNAIHGALTAAAGRPDWWDASAIHLAQSEATKLRDARAELVAKGNSSPSADDVIAATSMGLWTGLLSSGSPRQRALEYHDRLWLPHLEGAFQARGRIGRRELWGKVNDLRKLRNRIAHHEPIWHLNAQHVLKSIDWVLGAVSEDAAAFVRESERVSLMLRAKPRFFDPARPSPI